MDSGLALRAPGNDGGTLRDLAFEPRMSEAADMISDLPPSSAFFAAPCLRNEGTVRSKP